MVGFGFMYIKLCKIRNFLYITHPFEQKEFHYYVKHLA